MVNPLRSISRWRAAYRGRVLVPPPYAHQLPVVSPIATARTSLPPANYVPSLRPYSSPFWNLNHGITAFSVAAAHYVTAAPAGAAAAAVSEAPAVPAPNPAHASPPPPPPPGGDSVKPWNQRRNVNKKWDPLLVLAVVYTVFVFLPERMQNDVREVMPGIVNYVGEELAEWYRNLINQLPPELIDIVNDCF